ncbi:MAG: ketopantoate reductase family protein [Bdellovibrionales bacterium]|nr:ketopantoate reductase family protein [Bdellovibrionales bacterium]
MSKFACCIIGAGAVGNALAVLSSHNRETYLLVKPEHKKLYSEDLPEISGAIDKHASPDLRIITREDLSALPDRVDFWICTRAYDVQNIPEYLSLRDLNNDRFVLASNGLGLFMDLSVDLGSQIPIIRALFSFGVKKTSPTCSELSGSLISTIAARIQDEGFLNETLDFLCDLGFKTSKEQNIAIAEWRKVITNIIVNSLCTIANSNNGVIFKDKKIKIKAAEMLAEIKEVANRDGFNFSNLSEDVFFNSITPHASNINSTLAAIRNKKKTETDFFIGRFLKIANAYGIHTPVTSSVFEELKLIENLS